MSAIATAAVIAEYIEQKLTSLDPKLDYEIMFVSDIRRATGRTDIDFYSLSEAVTLLQAVTIDFKLYVGSPDEARDELYVDATRCESPIEYGDSKIDRSHK